LYAKEVNLFVMSKFHPLILVLLLSGLTAACKKDEKSSSGQQTLEEKYFEDYDAPRNKWGYINADGEVIIRPKYDDVLPFSEGVAGVNYRGKWGIIDKNGAFIVKPSYMGIGTIINGKAIARNFEGSYGLIDLEGKVIVKFVYDDLRPSGSYMIFSDGSLKGLMSKNGEILLTPSYNGVRVLSDSLVAVKENNEWFIKHTDHSLPVACGPYEEVFEFSEGLAAYQSDGKWGYLNQDCKVQIGPVFAFAESFKNELAPAMESGSYYLIDKLGQKVSGPFLFIQWLNGAWGAQTGEKWLLIDNKGKVVGNEGYDAIYPFSEGLAPVLSEGRWGYIDTTGKEKIPGVFVIPWSFQEGKARIMTSRGMQFLNAEGEILGIKPRNEYRDFSEGLAPFQE
jgi:hypothetical protein